MGYVMNYITLNTIKKIKAILPKFSDLPEQDVNLDHCVGKDYEIPLIGDLLHECGVLTHEEKSSLELLTPMRLTGSIDPHTDYNFVLHGLKKDALLVVIDSHVKSRGGLSSGGYSDDLRSNYFYHEEKGFLPITSGNVISFDVTKEHAVMLHGRLDLVTLWFDNVQEEEE